MARPGGLEPPAFGFEAQRSIRLSYGRLGSYFNGNQRKKANFLRGKAEVHGIH